MNVLDDLAHVLDEYEGCFDPDTNAALRHARTTLLGRLLLLRNVPPLSPMQWSEPLSLDGL